MTKIFRIGAFLLLLTATVSAQTNNDAYTKTLTARSTKIAEKLSITDSASFHQVVAILVNQYKSLGKIYDSRDAAIKTAKEKAENDKAGFQATEQALMDNADAQLYNLHCAFIGALSGDLSPKQIDEVKDGMTYRVLEVTYGAYLAMIPNLKTNEKRQIYSWLAEAREHAIDAQSAGKKHAWFNKFKGRINNYLSKQGYNMQQERVAWAKRIKESQHKK